MERADLTGLEGDLWDGFATGRWVGSGGPDPTADDIDPDEAWPEGTPEVTSRRVRAEVIAAILRGAVPTDPSHTPALRLFRSRITGLLDLSDAVIGCAIAFEECWFDGAPTFSRTQLQVLFMTRCRLPGLSGQDAHVAADIELRGCLVTGGVDVYGAAVAGILDLSGTVLQPGQGPALIAQKLSAASVLCRVLERADGTARRFEATGTVNLYNAGISGNLDLSGAALRPQQGQALLAEDLRAANVFCRVWDGADGTSHRFEATGTVNLYGADLSGNLILDGAAILPADGGDALRALNLTAADVLCRGWDAADGTGYRFEATGTVNLYGARLTGTLDLDGATIRPHQGDALNAESLTATHVNCRVWTSAGGVDHRFEASGTVNLYAASLTGNFEMDGAVITAGAGYAVQGQNLSATHLLCRAWETAAGTVIPLETSGTLNFGAADVRGVVALVGASLRAGDQLVAVNLSYSRISQGLYASPWLRYDLPYGPDGSPWAPFRCVGRIDLDGAVVNNDLHLDGAELTNPDGPFTLVADGLKVTGDVRCSTQLRDRDRRPATGPNGEPAPRFRFDQEIRLVNATITGSLVLTGAHDADGEVGFDLTGATLGRLRHDTDDPALRLDGTTYQALEPVRPARERLRWLAAARRHRPPADGDHPPSARDLLPQPYEQLAAEYRRLGHDADARRVLHARHRDQFQAGQFWLLRPFGWLHNALTGYGYRPARALIWLIGALAFGTWYFTGRRPVITEDGPAWLDESPRSAFVYTLDVVIPTSPFGLEGGVQHTVFGEWLATSALVALGYALGFALLPAISRLLTRP